MDGVASPPLWAAQRRELLTFTNDQCQLVRIETDDIDEAFRVFDSQNYRGKALEPHDLLKAYHLREMRTETPASQAAAVETWESVQDEDLTRLFSTYLYRILRWSRGESALRFTAQDIGVFKRISAEGDLPPSSRYHLAAQAARSLLDTMGASRQLGERDAKRRRFQLDAPVLGGRSFFEMVTFMLDELKRLARESFLDGEGAPGGDETPSSDLGKFATYDLKVLLKQDAAKEQDRLHEAPSMSRYRYVCELYLAALLYYTNRFGSEDIEPVRSHLFAWAYSLRVERLRVQLRSVDNRARGDGDLARSAFVLLRNASSGRVIEQLPVALVPYQPDHEKALADLLRGKADQ